jgi:hypothetical protein
MPVPDNYWSAESEHRPYRAASRTQAVAVALVRVLCLAAAFATAMAALSWSALCQDGDFDRCMNGHPSFELVFQVALAGLGLGLTLVVLRFTKRGSYRLAVAAFVLALLSFAAWALFLDAATHGWGDLKLLWLG